MSFRTAMRVRAAICFLFAGFFFLQPVYAQNAPKLIVTVTPQGAAANDKMIPVAATVSVNVTIRNDGTEPLSNIAVVAKLHGVKLSPDASWKEDGDDARFEIASLKANEEITRPLNLRVEMAPLPPGKLAEVNVEAKAADTTVTAAAKFPVGDCVSAFQSDLTRLRIGPLAEVWPTADEMRKPDTSLSRVRYFPIRPRRGDLAILDRLAAGYQARLLANYEFLQQGTRYTARRWFDELNAFTGQEPIPGLCAVNDQMLDGIRKTISYVTARIEPPIKAYARGIELLRKQFNADANDDLTKIALRVAQGAGAKFDNPPATAFEILASAKEQFKDAKLTPEQLDDLSLIESAAWVEAQAARSKKLYDLIEGTINGIGDAHKKNCTCAF